MSSTLADFSKLEKDSLRKSVIDGLRMESTLLEVVPWETIGQLSTTIVRYQELPDVGYRSIGEAYSEATGTTEQVPENIALLGGNIDTDKVLVRAGNTIAKERAVQQAMKLKAIAYEFNDGFINGSRVTDPEEFDGILLRLDGLAAAQRIDYTSTAIPNATVTAGLEFVDKVDELIYAIDGHKPDCLLMNSKCLLLLRSALRRASLLDTSKDQFGRMISSYGGIPLLDIGVKADQTTGIILNTETKGGGSTETSIYAVRFGVGLYLWGIQEYPLDVTDKGELEDGVTYRTVVDWPLGLANANIRSMARLYGIVTS